MTPKRTPVVLTDHQRRWAAATAVSVAWIILVVLTVSRLHGGDRLLVVLLAAIPMLCAVVIWTQNRGATVTGPTSPEWKLTSEKDARRSGQPSVTGSPTALTLQAAEAMHAMTQSGLFDTPPPIAANHPDMAISGNFSIVDMVSRLEPRGFHWIESSLAEQEFLGWTLTELQRKSFLDIVYPDDRQRAMNALQQTLIKGESLGLVIRIRTAQGKTKAIEVNAGARYDSSQQVSYLRCHITDVTSKVNAERELKLRTRELIQLNEQLRGINRELEELKDRYTDLYENAPAMYFSMDAQGRLIECNQTFLSTLNRRRDELIGQGFEAFLDRTDLERCLTLFGQLLEQGSIETESRWLRSNGEPIDVWISGKVIRNPRGSIEQTHCVAQDRTAKHRLEAELYAKNQSLAHANAELLRKNRELDEFVYVVSHDLQEPLRTLTAFSDFLIKDHAAQLDSAGREYAQRLLEAARRMRSMIQGLLNLSRAGKVTDEFGPVHLDEVVADLRVDLGELIRSRDVDLRLNSPNVVVTGDRRRLLQLFTNLVSNAVKYNTSAIPCVEIGAIAGSNELQSNSAGTARWVTLFVRDNGIGIDPRHHQRIFQLFRRLHSQQEYEGNGVGLSICSKIAQAHGGRVWVESTPAKGATFFVTLPHATNFPASSDPASAPRETSGDG